MKPVTVDNLFWAAGLIGQVALTSVLLIKGRWRSFPAFTALVALPMVVTLLIFPFRSMPNSPWYGRVYQTFAVLDFLLQIAVAFELARVVLRPTGTWVRDARKQFLLSGAAGAVVALALAYMVAPPAPTQGESLVLRANLFTSLLICELFLAVTAASNRLGLGWKNHVMAIGQGFTAWSLMATVVDSLHSYFGTRQLYESAEYFKSCIYLCVLWYWFVQLWREEPVRKPISPQLRKFIVALHERVQYDLGEAER